MFLGVLALGVGFALLGAVLWLAAQAVGWVLDYATMVLAEPLGDAVRVLANM